MDAEIAAIAAQATRVTEMRFGKSIKLVKHGSFRSRPAGWRLLVEGPVGGHVMRASDGFLYNATAADVNPFENPDFVFSSVVDAIAMAEALEANLGVDQKVVDPNRAFMSRFLNPETFERQAAYWASSECSVGQVLAR